MAVKKKNARARPLSLPVPADRRRFRQRLLTWYGRHGRDLPWRKTADPYHTPRLRNHAAADQVDRVLPKYAEWLGKYPSMEVLAEAPEQDVTRTWYPLGYNIRPKRLQSNRPGVGGKVRRPAPVGRGDAACPSRGSAPTPPVRSAARVPRARRDPRHQRGPGALSRLVANGDPKSHAMKRHLWAISETVMPYRQVFDFKPGADGFRRDDLRRAKPQVPRVPDGEKLPRLSVHARRQVTNDS